jgi:hypothetical protein
MFCTTKPYKGEFVSMRRGASTIHGATTPATSSTYAVE